MNENGQGYIDLYEEPKGANTSKTNPFKNKMDHEDIPEGELK